MYLYGICNNKTNVLIVICKNVILLIILKINYNRFHFIVHEPICYNMRKQFHKKYILKPKIHIGKALTKDEKIFKNICKLSAI